MDVNATKSEATSWLASLSKTQRRHVSRRLKRHLASSNRSQNIDYVKLLKGDPKVVAAAERDQARERELEEAIASADPSRPMGSKANKWMKSALRVWSDSLRYR